MDNNINLTILNEINKAAKMGMDSISYVIKKVGDKNMKENLTWQYSEYGKLLDRVNSEFTKYGEVPDETSVKDKMMGFAALNYTYIMLTFLVKYGIIK